MIDIEQMESALAEWAAFLEGAEPKEWIAQRSDAMRAEGFAIEEIARFVVDATDADPANAVSRTRAFREAVGLSDDAYRAYLRASDDFLKHMPDEERTIASAQYMGVLAGILAAHASTAGD